MGAPALRNACGRPVVQDFGHNQACLTGRAGALISESPPVLLGTVLGVMATAGQGQSWISTEQSWTGGPMAPSSHAAALGAAWCQLLDPSISRALGVWEAGDTQSPGVLKQELDVECHRLWRHSQSPPAQRLLIPKSWNVSEELPRRAAKHRVAATKGEDGAGGCSGAPQDLAAPGAWGTELSHP